MTAEEWRPTPGFDDYEISDLGRVMSRKGKQPRVLRPWPNGEYGYPSVTLRGNGRRQVRTVHSLVAEAFIGPRPDGLEVRHLNGDALDSRLSNLRYGTHADNMQDRLAHGRHPMASKTHCLRGHAFDEANTITYRGTRSCRACKRQRYQDAALRAANVPTATRSAA